MVKVKKYQKFILENLREYAKIKYSNVDAVNQLVVDKENHQYQIITIGWDNGRLIFAPREGEQREMIFFV
jgi:XisI protein